MDDFYEQEVKSMKDRIPLVLDFDGVLNNYKGYNGDNLGQPKEGAKEFLQELSKNYRIYICTARPKWVKVWKWLEQHDMIDHIHMVTNQKPAAYAYIDDRAIRFNGNYEQTLNELKEFKTYWEE